MTAYYRDLDDANSLLAPERDPATGQRVPAERSKRQMEPAESPPRSRRGWAVGAGIVGLVLVLVGGGALAFRGSSSNSTVTSDEATATSQTNPAEDSATPTSTRSEASATTTITPTTTTIAPTTVAATAAVFFARTSATLTTGLIDLNPAVTPNDPAATATVSGPFPGELTIACTSSGCGYPLVANAPGAVTIDGGVVLAAIDDRIVGVTNQVQPCTGDQGGAYSSTIATTHDLTLSEFVDIDGLRVPTRISGTIERFRPDAGYVPRVGEVVDQGREIGCAGQTFTFNIDAPLSLNQETP